MFSTSHKYNIVCPMVSCACGFFTYVCCLCVSLSLSVEKRSLLVVIARDLPSFSTLPVGNIELCVFQFSSRVLRRPFGRVSVSDRSVKEDVSTALTVTNPDLFGTWSLPNEADTQTYTLVSSHLSSEATLKSMTRREVGKKLKRGRNS